MTISKGLQVLGMKFLKHHQISEGQLNFYTKFPKDQMISNVVKRVCFGGVKECAKFPSCCLNDFPIKEC